MQGFVFNHCEETHTCFTTIYACVKSKLGQSEPAPTSAAWKMDDGKWVGNKLPLGSSSLANHGGHLGYFFLISFY